MLEDRTRGVVYVPIARELLPELSGWSDPVRIRLKKTRRDGEPELVVKKLEPGELADILPRVPA